MVAGDRFLLCTDGVWNVVPEEDFASAASGREPQRAAEHMVREALDHGAPDNATVVVVDIVDPRLSEEHELDLPRREQPDARSLWPAAGSLRAPVWPWLLLLPAVTKG